MLKIDKKHNKKIMYGSIVGSFVLLFFLMTVIFDPTSITYSSAASDTYNSVRISESGSASIDLVDVELPSCVKRISYIPEETDLICLVSIQCDNSPNGIPNGCSLNENTVSCHRTNDKCEQVSTIVDRAKDICGC